MHSFPILQKLLIMHWKCGKATAPSSMRDFQSSIHEGKGEEKVQKRHAHLHNAAVVSGSGIVFKSKARRKNADWNGNLASRGHFSMTQHGAFAKIPGLSSCHSGILPQAPRSLVQANAQFFLAVIRPELEGAWEICSLADSAWWDFCKLSTYWFDQVSQYVHNSDTRFAFADDWWISAGSFDTLVLGQNSKIIKLSHLWITVQRVQAHSSRILGLFVSGRQKSTSYWPDGRIGTAVPPLRFLTSAIERKVKVLMLQTWARI